MKQLMMAAALAVAVAGATGSVRAQVPQTALLPPQAAPAPSSPRANPGYPFALTPDDAYRNGLINRWEYERAGGSLPQALQGPPVDSNRTNGGDDRGG